MTTDSTALRPLSHDDIADSIDRYLALWPREQSRVAAVRDFLARGSDLVHRGNMQGHVTASGFVMAGNRVLLIRHRSLGRWLQPGGHVDPGESLAKAALREVLEETGIPCRLHDWHQAQVTSPSVSGAVSGAASEAASGAASPVPIDIDSHAIPANPTKGEGAHLHHDFRYLLVPLHDILARDDAETSDARWIDVADVAALGVDDNMLNAIARCRQIDAG